MLHRKLFLLPLIISTIFCCAHIAIAADNSSKLTSTSNNDNNSSNNPISKADPKNNESAINTPLTLPVNNEKTATAQINNKSSVTSEEDANLETKNKDKKFSEMYLSLSEKNLQTCDALLGSMKWFYGFVGGVVTLLITIFGFIGIKYAFPKIVTEQIKHWVKESSELKDIKKEIADSSKEINIALAQTYKNDGLDRWNEHTIDRAIELTEKALVFFKKACPGNTSKNKDDEILYGTICGNLSYYYASLKNHARYSKALEYALIAIKIGKKHHIMSFVDDYIYVVKQYDIRIDTIRDRAEKEFDNYKAELLKSNIINITEAGEYEKYFNQ